MRVLIADDDKGFLEILQFYLWNRGHEVQIATDGLACISALREFAPDVLVVARELLWGGGDGVVAEMRDDHLLCNIPVILIADSPEEFHPMADSFVVAWLQKPFRLSKLLVQLTAATRRAPSFSEQL
jgi:DNA-binding response OmpR family regulator